MGDEEQSEEAASFPWYTFKIKPFSANDMHYAKFKKDTVKYRDFKSQVSAAMAFKPIQIPIDTPLHFEIKIGYSNRASDTDNALKPTLDAIQAATDYTFNDSSVYKITAYKFLVPKGSDCFSVRFTPFTDYEATSIFRLGRKPTKLFK